LLDADQFKVIARRARKLGFRGQDADEVIQLTAIRLSRTNIRDEAMILSATDESVADVRRREARHQGRVERLGQLAMSDTVESCDSATAAALDLQAVIERLPARDRTVCDLLGRGLSTREVANQVGVSIRSVQFATRRIKKHFEESGVEGVLA
jgi:DNA-directed RNA polymerase specialized sigma24 family protein